MSHLERINLDALRPSPDSFRSQLTACWETWLRLREHARYRTARRTLAADLRKSYETLIDTKARALKATGVFGTRHENLEAAILNLAAAIEDYRDPV
ncbi:MAG: hypothetical protein AB7P20_06265 [Rhizobiaceae bacterium]